jgi:hypothetical protein
MRAAARVLFAAIVLLGFDRGLLRVSVPPWRPSAEALARRADPNPGLAAFLAGVHAHTGKGDAIVLVLPQPLWREAEAYLYRGSYHLAGREVLPPTPENVRRADYLAAWRVPMRGAAVWQGHGGVLVRRR